MTTQIFPHEITKQKPPQIGLVVLQTDETIEVDFRRLFYGGAELLVTRIPSGDEVTPETLAAMEAHMADAASLLPPNTPFAALGYACTSGSAQIGPKRVAEILRQTVSADAYTDPVTALVAACETLGIQRLGLLSPYMAAVSDRIRSVLANRGIETPVFGTFNVTNEARVVRITPASIIQAAEMLAAKGGIDALFLSCTNLRTLDVIQTLEQRLEMPVLSSNQVLAWHMAKGAGTRLAPGPWGQLSEKR